MNIYIPTNFINIYTTLYQGTQINDIILKYVPKSSIISDFTGGIGGNSFMFCRDFKYVNVIEKEYDLNVIIKNNLKDFNNKTIYIGNFNIFKNILKQDVIFIDPPWGGSDYKYKNNIDLYIDNVNILDIIDSLYNYTYIVCLKIPNNFNFKSIQKLFWNFKTYAIYKNKSKLKSVYKIIIFSK
tara:strand:+ start:4520 stop:5068 length:549 start_codon:yes stop_codon:yes gene_type:complete